MRLRLQVDWEEGEAKGPDSDYDHPVVLALQKVLHKPFFARYHEESKVIDIYCEVEGNSIFIHSLKFPEYLTGRENEVQLDVPDTFVHLESHSLFQDRFEKVLVKQDLENTGCMDCHMYHPVCKSINSVLKHGYFSLFDMEGRVEILRKNFSNEGASEHVVFLDIDLSPPFLLKEFHLHLPKEVLRDA